MDARNIYNQDCEFYRYQDKLRWNRFQTVAAIEAGILAAVLHAVPLELERWETLVFVVFAGVLVFTATWLAWRDQEIGDRHLNRLREYEGIRAFPNTRQWWTGTRLMGFSIILVNAFNVVVALWVLLRN